MAEKKFLSDINLGGNKILQALLQDTWLPCYSDADIPSSPSVGFLYYNTTKDAIGIWNGSQWIYTGQLISNPGTAYNKNYSTDNPLMDGVASPGAADNIARGDHRHPTDTTRASQSSLNAEITRAQEAESNLNTQIQGVQSQLGSLTTDIDEKIEGVQSQIDTVNTTLTQQIDDVQTQVETLETKHTTEIKGVQGQITNLQNKHTSDITGVQGQISDLSDTTNETIEGVQSRIETLETKEANDIKGVQGQISSLQTKHASDITGVQGQINSLSSSHDKDITGVQGQIALKSNIASPTFTGTPKAPTPGISTNTTQIATTAFVQALVDSKISAANAMHFEGTLGTNGTVKTLPDNHKSGDMYVVATAGTYAGEVCEVGDMVICITTGTEANNGDWAVVQTNINGAVTGPTSSVNNRVALFNGATGKIIKQSSLTESDISATIDTVNDFFGTQGSQGNSLEQINQEIIELGKGITGVQGELTDLESRTITGVDGLKGGGNLTQSRTISHGNKPTSGTSISASGTYVNSISIDAYGHIATITKATPSNLTIQFNGTTVGSTYNGTAARTINITADASSLEYSDGVSIAEELDNKVDGPASSVDNHVVIFNGTTGKLIQDSGFTIGKSVPSNAVFTDTKYSIATSSTAGLVKPISVITKPTINTATTTSGKYYPVQMSSDGNMFVNVPWVNTTYSVATTSTNGLMSSAMVTKLNGIATGANKYVLPTSTADALGGIKIGFPESGKNYPVELNDDGQAFVNVPWTDNNTTYSQATSSKLGLVKIGYTESGKNYPVELNSSGQMFVNVPWSNTTYSVFKAATTSAAGGTGLVPAPAAGENDEFLRGDGTWAVPTNTTYSVFKAASSSAAGGSGLVPAPAAGENDEYLRGDGTWATPTNTTYAKATSSTLGLVKIGFPESGKNYPVELNSSGQMFVNVPWTDNNTTYGIADYDSNGLIKPWYSHTAASKGPTAGSNATAVTVNAISTTSGRYYALEMDSAGRGFVNVPWTNTTYGVATTSANGLMSSAMVTKLNGIQTGADAVSFSRSLSSGTKIGTITINGTGTDLYCQTNTDTHYTTHLYATTSSGTADASATNGNVYLRLFDNTTARDSINIKGTGATTVTSNSSGVITINSTNTNTTYTFANGSSGNFTVTPSGGSAQTVSIGKPATAGKADTATKLATSRTISLTGDVTGSASFDGSANASITATVANNSHTHTISNISDLNSEWDNNLKNTASITYRSATTGATQGWYRIAQAPVSIVNCMGLFQITAAVAGYHTSVLIAAGISYGVTNSVQLIQLANSSYSSIAIDQVRIVYHTTYQDHYAYLEVHTARAAAITITSRMFGDGWTALTANTAGSIPSGYTSKTLTLSTSSDIVADSFKGALSGNASTASSAAKLTTARALKIGNTSKNFDGSAGLTWTLSEIGAAASNDTFYIGTTQISLNRASASQTLSGVSVSGSSGSCTGNAATASALATARTISLTGDVTGSVSFKGNANVSISTTVANASHTHTVSNLSNLGSNWSSILTAASPLKTGQYSPGVTTLTNSMAITSKHYILAKNNGNKTMSLSGFVAGDIAQVCIYNTTSTAFTQEILNDSTHLCSVDSVEVPAKGYVELSIWYINGVYRIKVLED